MVESSSSASGRFLRALGSTLIAHQTLSRVVDRFSTQSDTLTSSSVVLVWGPDTRSDPAAWRGRAAGLLATAEQIFESSPNLLLAGTSGEHVEIRSTDSSLIPVGVDYLDALTRRMSLHTHRGNLIAEAGFGVTARR